MTEPTIICPSCKAEIKLNESLAAPLIEATRKEFEKRLAQKDADIANVRRHRNPVLPIRRIGLTEAPIILMCTD